MHALARYVLVYMDDKNEVRLQVENSESGYNEEISRSPFGRNMKFCSGNAARLMHTYQAEDFYFEQLVITISGLEICRLDDVEIENLLSALIRYSERTAVQKVDSLTALGEFVAAHR